MDLHTKDVVLLVSQRLTLARRARDLSLARVAATTRISRRALHAWEAGENMPGAVKIRSLARIYEVSADWLLGLDSVVRMQE